MQQMMKEIEKLKLNISTSRSNTQKNTAANQERTRVHVEISNRFKNKEHEYSGHDYEDLDEFFTEYSAVSSDFGLNNDQKFKFLHNLFRGDALRF